MNCFFVILSRRSVPEKSLYSFLQRGGCFRRKKYGCRDRQQHGRPVRCGFANGGLKTLKESGRNSIKPQARLHSAMRFRAAFFQGCDINSNPSPSGHHKGVRRITALFPTCREPSGDGFDCVLLPFIESLHAPCRLATLFSRCGNAAERGLDSVQPERFNQCSSCRNKQRRLYCAAERALDFATKGSQEPRAAEDAAHIRNSC